MMNQSNSRFMFCFAKLCAVFLALAVHSIAYTQNTPAAKITLSATTNRQPAKGRDTIRYQAEISNIGDTAIFNMMVGRTGDPNTTLIPGSFQSTPVAIPAAFPTILEDQSVSLVLNGVDPDGDKLDFVLVQNTQNGVLGGITSLSNTSASIQYQPNPDFSGNDQFTFFVLDNDGNRDTSAILLSILPVNDAPSFSGGADVTVLEDAGQQTLANWATNLNAGNMNEVDQVLIFNILNNDNVDLFAALPSVNPEGTLTFTGKENTAGTATLVLNIQDNGGTDNGGVNTSAPDTLMINILPVNDAPAFTKGNNIIIKTDTTLQTFANWATAISAGPADEQSQTLTFIIESNDNPSLFEIAPQISADGTLTFKAAPEAVGVANISIRLKDDGGVENNGIDLSNIHTFSITLEM
ncbi:MAG: Ig-like domain-containing protein [Saprospiraceae bacterium]